MQTNLGVLLSSECKHFPLTIMGTGTGVALYLVANFI